MNVTALEVERAGEAVTRRLGLRLESTRRDAFVERLLERTRATSRGIAEYLVALEGDLDELAELAEPLLIGESYFMRHAEQLEALRLDVLPDRVAARRGERRLELLSAGCSNGEEAYSLAILLLEAGIDDFCIRAVDVNAAAIARAQAGCYGPWSLRQTSDALRQRWFTGAGREQRVAGALAELVRFERRNLADDDGELWQPNQFDVVLCRNVIMYLSVEAATLLVARIARALAPGGYLMLGHAETLRGLSQDFQLCQSRESFYYKKRERREAAALGTPSPPPIALAPVLPSTDWMEAISRSSERIAELDSAAARIPAAPASSPGSPLARATALFAEERFGAALEALGDGVMDADTLLLRAATLLAQGAITEARSACGALLAVDDLSAAGHYVMALCSEHEGEVERALAELRAATYLDPSFALPHLRLGLILRRRGDVAGARRALEQAARRLELESPAQILMFGGGFSRAALAALCAAELGGLGDG